MVAGVVTNNLEHMLVDQIALVALGQRADAELQFLARLKRRANRRDVGDQFVRIVRDTALARDFLECIRRVAIPRAGVGVGYVARGTMYRVRLRVELGEGLLDQLRPDRLA